jgi:outer membrane protein OmpA-like peptidoglycan-associated protein/uncharacterized protein YegP (UPF0339 family)
MSDKNYSGKQGGDNYKPLKFYQDRITGVDNGFDMFSEQDAHYFTYNVDGAIALISEGYTTSKGRDNGIKSVDKNRTIAARYKRDRLSSGQEYFSLIAGNHQEIATSAWFQSAAAMDAVIARLMGGDTDAAVQPVSAIASPVVGGFDVKARQANPSNVSAQDETSGGANYLWWLLPLLVFLLVWYLFAQCCQQSPLNSKSSVAAPVKLPEPIEIVSPAAEPVVVNDRLGDFLDSQLPDGSALSIPEFGVENQLIQFIRDDARPVDKTTWFNFDRIGFDTGKADLTLESREQIVNIASIMKAYPAVKLKIGGYTDNTGTLAFNQRLSQDRAESVMNALITQGVSQERVAAEGYGPQYPVASNDTEDGRAQNRRIALRVTEK